MKRWVLIFCVMLALLLTGCAGQGKDDSEPDIGTGGEETVSFLPEGQTYIAEWGGSFSYRDLFWPERLVMADGAVYYAENSRDEENGKFYTALYCWEEGKAAESIYTIENSFGPHLLTDGQGYLYCLYTDRSDETLKNKPARLLKLSLEGEPVYDRLAAPEGGESTGEALTGSLEDAMVTVEGQVCVCDSDGMVYFFDGEGKLTRTAKASPKGADLFSDYGFVRAGEDWYLYAWEGSELTCQKVAPEDGTVGQAVSLSLEDGYLGVCDGENGILIKGQNSLSLYIPGQDEPVEVLQWSGRGIGVDPGGVETAVMEEDNVITCLYYSRNGDGYLYQWLSLEPGKELQEPGEEYTIRLGLVERYYDKYVAAELDGIFEEFYKLYPNYNIEIVTYDIENTDFALDLVKGNGPDLISTQFLDVVMLTEKGVLEDLRPYLAASEMVGEEDLLPSVLRAMKVNGKMVRVLDEFTARGNVVAAGTTNGGAWTPEEYLNLADQQTPGVYLDMFMSRKAIFNTIIKRAEYSYVDRENRECYFTDGRFARLLERIVQVSVEDTGLLRKEDTDELVRKWECYHSGQTLMAANLDINDVRVLIEMKDAFGEDSEFAGYPNYEGIPQYEMIANHEFAINSASDKKDIAWAFLEMLLSRDYQSRIRMSGYRGYFRSVREDVLEEECDGVYSSIPPKAALGTSNQYNGQSYFYPEGIPPMTQEERAELRYVLDNAYMDRPARGMIYDIIWEEVQVFFAGDKTADEVAEIIQNRVSLYLNE